MCESLVGHGMVTALNFLVLLLDSGDEEVLVTDDGRIQLSRQVASVEHKGKLKVLVKAWHGDNFLLKDSFHS